MRGHLHPISSLIREANHIFGRMGFALADGPLLEDEWHNFDALNVPNKVSYLTPFIPDTIYL